MTLRHGAELIEHRLDPFTHTRVDVQRQRLATICDRQIEVAHHSIRVGAVPEEIGIVRVELEGLRNVGDGEVIFSLAQVLWPRLL